MYLSDLWSFFQETIFTLPGSAGSDLPAINFYQQEIAELDQPRAAEMRRQNLEAYVQSFPERPRLLLVGEAPGWRGCRFSGVPFTSEAQLEGGELPFQGVKTSLSPKAHREASATIFWEVLRPLHAHFFVWNALPLHLHHPGRQLSNRPPSRREIRWAAPMLRELLGLLQPQTVLAAGISASSALDLAGIKHLKVRHPAHGGARDFRSGIESLKNSITIGL